MKWKSHHKNRRFWNEAKLLDAKSLICISLLLICCAPNIATAERSAENKDLIKAAFVYNFAKFTHWPENTWRKKSAPLNLCIAGRDKLADNLRKLTNKSIKGHPLSVLSLKYNPYAQNCHLLYIASSEIKGYREILATTHKKPILTISEIKGFSYSGGIIELYDDKGKNRFIINLQSANDAGIEFSARLLNLAIVINQEEAE